jgi:hypothetical protein
VGDSPITPWDQKLFSVLGVDTELLLLISEGIEPSTFSVLTKCDNRYTMKPCETHGRCCDDAEKQTNTYSESQKYLILWTSKLYRNRSQNQTTLSRRNIRTKFLTARLIQSRAAISIQLFCTWNLRQTDRTMISFWCFVSCIVKYSHCSRREKCKLPFGFGP